MAVSSVAVKVLVPVLLAGGGAVALVTAPAAQPAPAAQLWIDSPLDGSRIDPGSVTVVAHAADGLDLDAMALVVDGTEVARRSDLTTYNRLAGVQFDWTATDGYHFLVITGGGVESAAVAVRVGEATAPGTAAPSATAKPSATPTASATPTPSATATAAPTASATPARPTRTPSPTAAPTTAAPPTLGAVTVTPNAVGPAEPACTGDITVRANVSGATSGSARVYRTNLSKNIGGSISGGVFTATFKQADLYGYNTSGDFSVSVTVTNKAGSITKDGSFSVYCSKD